MNAVVAKWFVEAVRQRPWHSACLVALSLVTSLADGLSVSLLIPFLSTLFHGAEVDTTDDSILSRYLKMLTEISGKGNELVVLSSAIVGLVLLRVVLSYFEGGLSTVVSAQISHTMRLRMHQNLLATRYEYICITDNAKLLNTLDSEAWNVTEAITVFFQMIHSAFMVAVFTSILLAISWKTTLLVAVMVLALSLVMRVFDQRTRSLADESLLAGELLYDRANELFGSMRIIRAFGREAASQRAYDEASQRLNDVSLRSDVLSRQAGSVREVTHTVMFVVVIFCALALGVSQAPLIAYLAVLHRLQPHVLSLDEARMYLVSMHASIRAVNTMLTLEPAIIVNTDPLPVELARSIDFEHVTFTYQGKDKETRNALEDVSLSIPVGKTTAIVGWSGAGKSTLMNLLYRLHEPKSGTITVDGTPLTRFDVTEWRRKLAIAGQDADLIEGTVFDNIAFGHEAPSAEQVMDAARRAQVHDFISSLPKGYDTRVGQRGLLLSGGQRQRIGLARALIRNSPVLILDEATNSLDSMVETEIYRSLEELHGHATIIVIAHRLSTTRLADQVIVLADGRVVESGTPDELSRNGGLFSRMVQLQELAVSLDASPAEIGMEDDEWEEDAESFGAAST
jgi:subfamily B ATP-binding cassette protein MsbA